MHRVANMRESILEQLAQVYAGTTSRLTCVSDIAEVFADAGKLCGGHAHDCCILGVRDAQVLAVDVHQLEFKVRDAVIFYTDT
jgi:hypothetical protein